MEPARRRAARAQLIRALVISGLLVVVYFLAPVEPAATGARALVRAALAVAGLVVVAVLVARLAIRLLRDESGAGAALLVALVGGVVMFAFVDYLVALSRPDQFADLETKTDGLYFAVTTLTTTGFGDVHARGELARALVTVQMVYNIAVIATGASALVNRLTTRRREPPGPRR